MAVFVDAMPRGGTPGTLYLIEPELDDEEAVPDAHGMDPVTVLALARELGDPLPRVLVVGCEPSQVLTLEDDVVAELSAPVRAVVDDAVRMVERLLDDLVEDGLGKGAGDMKKRGVVAAALVAATGAAVAPSGRRSSGT